MKFLVDAQLPARLATFLTEAGHDAVHTTQLPDGNRTTDATIAKLADRDDRIVVTEDRDFRDGHLLGGSPRRLLIVATGNVTNAALLGRRVLGGNAAHDVLTAGRWSMPRNVSRTTNATPPTRAMSATLPMNQPL